MELITRVTAIHLGYIVTATSGHVRERWLHPSGLTILDRRIGRGARRFHGAARDVWKVIEDTKRVISIFDARVGLVNPPELTKDEKVFLTRLAPRALRVRPFWEEAHGAELDLWLKRRLREAKAFLVKLEAELQIKQRTVKKNVDLATTLGQLPHVILLVMTCDFVVSCVAERAIDANHSEQWSAVGEALEDCANGKTVSFAKYQDVTMAKGKRPDARIIPKAPWGHQLQVRHLLFLVSKTVMVDRPQTPWNARSGNNNLNAYEEQRDEKMEADSSGKRERFATDMTDRANSWRRRVYREGATRADLAAIAEATGEIERRFNWRPASD